jgi:hypothetical protein
LVSLRPLPGVPAPVTWRPCARYLASLRPLLGVPALDDQFDGVAGAFLERLDGA